MVKHSRINMTARLYEISDGTIPDQISDNEYKTQFRERILPEWRELKDERGRHLLHEHPWTARSWRLPDVAELLEHPAVGIVQGHMCQFRMMSHVDRQGGEMGLVKKPKGFMSSSKFILEELDKKCPGGHQARVGRNCREGDP